MSQALSRVARFDIRVPSHIRETVEFAAMLQGRNLTDFLVSAMLEKAETVIGVHRRMELTLRDQAMLAKALCYEEPQEPDAFVRGIATEYKVRVRSV